MNDRLLAIEVHEVMRAFTLRAKLEDFDPELELGFGDVWHVRVGSGEGGDAQQVQEALALVRDWLLDRACRRRSFALVEHAK
jgi:hypothetical protein